MFTRLIVGAALLTASAAGAPAAPTASLPSEIRASLVTFPEVTRVCDHYLLGQYVVVHDEGSMARGEPCTTFYKPGKEGARPIVSFHCIPRHNGPVAKITVATRQVDGTATSTRALELVEYQFAGDTEAHGVPER